MDKTSKQKVALGLLLTLLSISFICASITPVYKLLHLIIKKKA